MLTKRIYPHKELCYNKIVARFIDFLGKLVIPTYRKKMNLLDNVDHLIKKVSKHVSFGQPVASGSVINQRISDPRIPILACYMTMKPHNGEDNCYYEAWLEKDGVFAVTEARYKETTVTRSLLHSNLTYEQMKEVYGEEDVHAIVSRMVEIIKKSENDDWSRFRRA